MKKINLKTTKKCVIALMTAALTVGMLAGCGDKGAAEADGTEINKEPIEEVVESEEVDQEIVEDAEEVVPPFLADLEKYDSIISTLTTDQYYAFAGVGEDYDVLLVTDGVYDYGDGIMAAIDAKVYGFDSNGKLYEAGSIWSDGTAYPIAVYEDELLMFGGNHSMTMANVREASVLIQKEAYEEFDEQGNATYYLNEGDIDNIKVLDDDSVLKEMYEAYANAVVVSFFQGEGEAVPEGDMELGDYPSNAFEERVGKTSFESTDEIIGLLEGDEAYALVDVKGIDDKVLLVASFTYDDLLGHMATTECTPYTLKSTGFYTADSILVSGGTATPVSMDKEGVFYTATHRSVEKQCYGDNGTENAALMMLASVYAEELDDNGVPTKVGGFERTKNSLVDDDCVFFEGDELDIYNKLFDEYSKTEPINFTKAN